MEISLATLTDKGTARTDRHGLPHYCTSFLNRLSDRLWERRLNVRTAGGQKSDYFDARAYGYLSYHTYLAIFDRLQLGPTDVVADVGSGKGRVVCVAATYNVREVIGIEIDLELCDMGRANATRMRGRRSPLRFVCRSATDYDFEGVTVIVMFHPFGEMTLRRMLVRLRESLEAQPRALQLVYCNPVLDAVVAEQPWLERYERWMPGTWSRLKFEISFYRHVRFERVLNGRRS